MYTNNYVPVKIPQYIIELPCSALEGSELLTMRFLHCCDYQYNFDCTTTGQGQWYFSSLIKKSYIHTTMSQLYLLKQLVQCTISLLAQV